ncbi:UDP-N-acetylmuramoyl-tripeptide--D-alanyl-D-alanine ligase [Gordonia araii NBRC 100433]|uniref:UDP-N-acetylmuramoyl-tripeptide--D-alanyl-D-alanine ligase n=1 Tax=Gordonia araii NBRC 100433 TaxID=1073574 RepID=G7H2U4_9ACTN|nr:hypothetical protein [Gordonia araii]GAB10169.1 UDP-N-acetylmuramoyl-tripeptide--D-alanyl-D-alanine ligase [Gordonia araii NBRC 100433]
MTGTVTVLVASDDASIAGGKALLRRLVEVAADTGAGSAHRDRAAAARTWFVLGEFPADDVQRSVVEHDSLGRAAVRLAVDKVVCVGESRVVRAAHQGAVMEGSWGDEAVLVASAGELAQRWSRADATSGPGAPGAGDVIALAGGFDPQIVVDALAQRDLVIQRI